MLYTKSVKGTKEESREKQKRRDRGDPSDSDDDDNTPGPPPKKLSRWKKVIADVKNKATGKGKSKNTKTPVKKTGKTKSGKKGTKDKMDARAYFADDPRLYTVDNTKCPGMDPDLNERMYPATKTASKKTGKKIEKSRDDRIVFR